jgi:hypothetical protein
MALADRGLSIRFLWSDEKCSGEQSSRDDETHGSTSGTIDENA